MAPVRTFLPAAIGVPALALSVAPLARVQPRPSSRAPGKP